MLDFLSDRSECEICGAVDRVEDRTMFGRTFSLCQNCCRIADTEYLTEESVEP